jgi:HK97 family phage major capsid protein
MTEEEKKIEAKAKEINDSIEALKASVDEKASVEDLGKMETKHTEITDQLKAFASQEDMTKQQTQLDEISTQLKGIGEIQDKKVKSFSEQMLGHLKSDDFKAKVKANSGRGEIASFEIVQKAADIDTDDINSGTIETQMEGGVASAPWRPTPVRAAVRWGTIGQGRDSISWWEETTRTDSAEVVTEQAAPGSGSAKTWTKQSMDIKMIKDFTKVSKSALEDFEYINSEVNDLMQNGIPRELEDQLIDGTGLTKYLTGITEYCQTFAKPDNFSTLVAPNAGDVLVAAVLQCMNGNTSDTEKKGYLPSLILLNPGTKVDMRLVKSTIETYVKHPYISDDGTVFDGIRIATSLDLAAGEFIVGDFNQAKAYMKRNMRISFHYENEDDVLNDLVLVLASIRVAGLKVTTPGAYAFVTGTVDAGQSLIELQEA